MSDIYYLVLIGLYLLGACGLFAVFYWWTHWPAKRWSRWLANTLRVVVFSILFAPALLHNHDIYAPAWAVSILDELLGKEFGAARAGMSILATFILISVVCIMFSLVMKTLRRKESQSSDS